MKNAVIVALVFAAVAAFAGDQDFTLVNETGLTIVQFFCSTTTTNNWEEDVLGVDVLNSGEEVNISFSRNEDDCEWDLMIVDEDGDQIAWAGIDLCEAMRITLYYENGEPTAQIENAVVEEEDEYEDEEEEE
jgi:hypothetical protein